MTNEEIVKVFETLQEIFKELDVDFFLIGAFARQIWYEREGLAFRSTKDIDYAVLVSSIEEYNNIKNMLISKYKFTPHQQNAFVLIGSTGIQVDILPFAEIQYHDEVTIKDQGMTSIKVDGMYEVFNHGTEIINLNKAFDFKIATLSGIALLKFIAYDDRPEVRQKDITDIANLIKHYFDLHTELIFNQHNDLFHADEIELVEIAAIVLGREMNKIAYRNKKLTDRLNSIFTNHLQLKENSNLIKLMLAADTSDRKTLAYQINLLSKIQEGFNT